LGAGASWHYGCPTGESLVDEVIAAAEKVASHFNRRIQLKFANCPPDDFLDSIAPHIPKVQVMNRYAAATEMCQDFAHRLRTVSPVVIDYFLGWNKDLAELGRTLIAIVLLQREKAGGSRINYNHILRANAAHVAVPRPGEFKDNWLRFVVHQMLIDCVGSDMLLKNELNVLTFNYDRSAERAIRAALEATQFLHPSHVGEFMGGSRFTHLYGALEDVKLDDEPYSAITSFTGSEASAKVAIATRMLNACHQAGANIRVIDPVNKHEGEHWQGACQMLREAERIYILGFGFDPNNVARLGWPLSQTAVDVSLQKIYFTNLDNAMTVNKRVMMALNASDFWRPENFAAHAGYNARAEKSTRDC
jgi:hypothetical protein